MKRNEILGEHKKGVRAVKYNAKPKSHIEPPKTTNPVAKNANAAIGGGAAGAHKDAKKTSQAVRGQKHKAQPEMAEGYNPNSAGAEHRRKLDQSHAADLKARAEGPDATERDQQRYQNYLDKKERMANDYNDRMEREGIEQEALYRSHGSSSAYDRDYASSVSGMGRREKDMSDEANLLYIYKDGRLKQRMVSNTVEREARAEGFRDTPEQALKIHGIIRSKFNPSKWVQKEGDKWVEVHPFGDNKSEATGDALGTISATTPDGKVSIKTATGDEIKTDQSALMPGANGTVQMKPDAAGDALKPGAKVVSTEEDMMTPPVDSTSPIHGGNNSHGEHNEIISLLKRMMGNR
jgi:hypothetical protein